MTHLVLSHIPPVGIAFCLLLFVLGMILHSVRVQRLALFFAFLTTLFSVWVYLSGPGVEEVARTAYPYAIEKINAHKEAATTAFVITLGTGFVCFLGLLRGNSIRKLARWYQMIVSLLLIISLALLMGTAGIGLRIARPWLQNKVSVAAPTQPADTTSAPNSADTP
ncbi:MAG: hypothetical protein ABIJ61_14815 [bacterium]